MQTPVRYYITPGDDQPLVRSIPVTVRPSAVAPDEVVPEHVQPEIAQVATLKKRIPRIIRAAGKIGSSEK